MNFEVVVVDQLRVVRSLPRVVVKTLIDEYQTVLGDSYFLRNHVFLALNLIPELFFCFCFLERRGTREELKSYSPKAPYVSLEVIGTPVENFRSHIDRSPTVSRRHIITILLDL